MRTGCPQQREPQKNLAFAEFYLRFVREHVRLQVENACGFVGAFDCPPQQRKEIGLIVVEGTV